MVKRKKVHSVKASGVKLARRNMMAPERVFNGKVVERSGIRAWEAIDPLTAQEREEIRIAMKNPYVKRACRIQANFVTSQGYTTKIVNRDEEELPEEQQTAFEKTPIYVPLFDQKFTPEEIKDKIDRMMIKMDLNTNIYNLYYTALQQGRAVLAMTPLQKNPDADTFFLPNQFRFIRPEHTLRPVIDQDTGELKGVRLIGIESDQRDNILVAERMVYMMHGFNNELFSDYYGDSKVIDVADIASNLNVILNQDYEQAALHSWFTPPIFSVPVPPQEFGNEEGVLHEFLQNVSDSKGQITAVTRSSDPEDQGVELLNNGGGSQSGNIAGLDVIRLGLIKSIIAHFGIPGFMISEGDVGQLGGNTNLSELDNYLQAEISPERTMVQNTINSQIYDAILKLLWQVEDERAVPIALRHHYNKPKLVTIMPPELYNVLIDMMDRGIIEEDGLREIIGLEEFSAEKKTQGSDTSPGENRSGNDWTDKQWKPKPKDQWADAWNSTPVNGWANPTDQWASSSTPVDQWEGGAPIKNNKGWIK